MTLTGKSKQYFEAWLSNQDVAPYTVMFDSVPLIVQHAYIIKWLDSVGIYALPLPSLRVKNKWNYCVYDKSFKNTQGKSYNALSRQEATTEAIKQANIIYNENN